MEEARKEIEKRMEKVKYKIVVISGKGGVGKTTVAVNLAVSLARKGLRVGLLDADLHGPNVPKMLGVEGERPGVEGGEVLPVESQYGVKVMSLGFLLSSRDSPVIWRGPLKATAIRQFLGEVRWGELDYLVVDLPPGCLSADARVLTPRGPLRIAEVDAGDAVYCFDGRKLVVRRVLEAAPQGVARLFELRTESHRIRGTADHPVLVAEGGRLSWRKLLSIEPGALVPVLDEDAATRRRPPTLSLETVVGIDAAGVGEVYDLRVEGGSFIADGFVVHNTGDEPLSVAQLIPKVSGAIVVTTPQDVALLDSRKAVVFASQLNIPVIGIIENMSGFVCPNCGARLFPFKVGGGRRAAAELGVPFLGSIPFEPGIVEAGDDGVPFVVKNVEAAKTFEEIVGRVREFLGDRR
ncbi:MAG: P-loop NTPase [Candidatus Alkanophagales archaeon]